MARGRAPHHDHGKRGGRLTTCESSHSSVWYSLSCLSCTSPCPLNPEESHACGKIPIIKVELLLRTPFLPHTSRRLRTTESMVQFQGDRLQDRTIKKKKNFEEVPSTPSRALELVEQHKKNKLRWSAPPFRRKVQRATVGTRSTLCKNAQADPQNGGNEPG